MSYHIYTTDCIILKRTGTGEADVSLHILTQDLGLVVASAKSARLSVSKLRSSLQEYSNIKISLVKGKNGWKITNVADSNNFFFSTSPYSRKLLAQISLVLQKMIVGEYPQKNIYDLVKKSFASIEGLKSEDVGNLEILTVLRILHLLGYVERDEIVKSFLVDDSVSALTLKGTQENRKHIISVINKALKESQL